MMDNIIRIIIGMGGFAVLLLALTCILDYIFKNSDIGSLVFKDDEEKK